MSKTIETAAQLHAAAKRIRADIARNMHREQDAHARSEAFIALRARIDRLDRASSGFVADSDAVITALIEELRAREEYVRGERAVYLTELLAKARADEREEKRSRWPY